MHLLPTTILSLDDWIVTFRFQGGKTIVKGCSPKMDQEDAIALCKRYIPDDLLSMVAEITAMRRRDKGLDTKHAALLERITK